jgi:hypothetical protein
MPSLRNGNWRLGYAGASDNEVWDERQKALLTYDDVVAGIITEARKNAVG